MRGFAYSPWNANRQHARFLAVLALHGRHNRATAVHLEVNIDEV
jgi:hypothetical protein